MHLLGVVHFVKLLAFCLLFSSRSQNGCVPADLNKNVNKLRLPKKQTVKTHLLNQIEEVSLRVRSVGWRSLVGLVKGRDSRVQDADRTFAEAEVFRR